jgi:hypothetical protein
MTYKNTYQETPMATLPTTPVVEAVTESVQKQVKSFTTQQRWILAGVIAAIIMPLLVYFIGFYAFTPLTGLFESGFLSANSLLAVVGSMILGALLIYGAYRVRHKEPDRVTSTNPAWPFKYAKRTMLIYALVPSLLEMFGHYSPAASKVLSVTIPALFPSFLYRGDKVALLITCGLLIPMMYELVVSNLLHREIKRNVSGLLGFAAHMVLFMGAYVVCGGNLLVGLLISWMAARTFAKYNHASYPVSILMAISVLSLLAAMGVVMDGIFYVVAYILLSFFQKMGNRYVCNHWG